MKQAIAFLILTAPLLAAENGGISDTERAFLVQQLEDSKKEMLASISGLTASQWRFKPAPNVWSVAEVAEHIILAEGYFSNAVQQILKTPAVERPATSSDAVDHKLVAGVKDRSHKATAPEPIVPAGKFETPEDAAREFTAQRDRNIAYAKATSDELRVHITKNGPIGTMDAYQLLLMMAAHSARHTAQIREVEANVSYPKTAARLQAPPAQ